ncbi:Phospholipid:diacylglycerol acyltransferase [Smittium culicis]|uniref:Phospholipid:diacylglycerol acyltransferase n=1 Tax=Smittium culicis TaxID=133412 RepID=A0A1R1XUX8_9FUNG|nr:Phospholipid:diacylglycerol acyltransferase [Smittium culicis]
MKSPKGKSKAEAGRESSKMNSEISRSDKKPPNIRNRSSSIHKKSTKPENKKSNSPGIKKNKEKLRKVSPVSTGFISNAYLSSFFKKFNRFCYRLFKSDHSEKYFEGSIVQKELIGTVGISQRRRFWFVIGIILGLLAASVPINNKQFKEASFAEFRNMFPSNFGEVDFFKYYSENLIPEETYKKILSMIKSDTVESTARKPEGLFEPAKTLKKTQSLKPKHSVVMIPGVFTSGLENWCTEGCLNGFFRNRIWGSMTMFKAILLDKQCWFKHMLLDDETGLDPENIRIRATKGLEAVEYFMTGYWVWAKVIDNLSEIGYDNHNMHVASYDWRLSIPDLETRDSYFTKLKLQIEMYKQTKNEKSVIISHSMGSLVATYFLKWVESPEHGNGGPDWVNDHIESWVNTAGALLGTAKSFSSLLSGETGETVQPLTSYLLEKYMSRNDRSLLFRNWGSIYSMIPKGGNKIWGNENVTIDDDELPLSSEKSTPSTNGLFIRILNIPTVNTTTDSILESDIKKNLTLDESVELLRKFIGKKYSDRLDRNYNLGLFTKKSEFDAHKYNHTTFSNPLTFQLPNAPNMKIYSFYGVGLKSERAYYYSKRNETEKNDDSYLGNSYTTPNVKYIIDNHINDANSDTQSGVVYSSG